MKTGFFSVYGNHLDFSKGSISYIIYFVFLTLTILTTLLIAIFHRFIRQRYYFYDKNKLGISRIVMLQIVGVITLLFILTRIVLQITIKMPKYWEIIPFQFCRFILCALAIMLIFKKIEWIKYFGFLGIVGAYIALFTSSLHYSLGKAPKTFVIGLDNFYYYDYLFAHIYIVILSSFLLSINKSKTTFKDTLITIGIFTIAILIAALVNYLLKNHPESWRSNYFFLKQDKTGDRQNSLLGILTDFPYSTITFIILGTMSIILWTTLQMLFDKIYFNYDSINKKFIFKTQQSFNWQIYKQSFNLKQKDYDKLKKFSYKE